MQGLKIKAWWEVTNAYNFFPHGNSDILYPKSDLSGPKWTFWIPFWAAASKEIKSCGTQGNFCLSVYLFIHPSLCPPGLLRPGICPLTPEICQFRPKICPLRPWICPLRPRFCPPRPWICPPRPRGPLEARGPNPSLKAQILVSRPKS